MKDHHKTKTSSGESKWKVSFGFGLAGLLVVAAGVLIPTLASAEAGAARPEAVAHQMPTQHPDQVLDWNQIFVDTLIATNTPNSSSQRLGAIVHAAIFDAYNGIERRYAPIFVDDEAPAGASRRAAVIASAYTALVALFPAREPELSASYAASLAALGGGDGGRSRERGILWGEQVAQAVLGWRASDGFGASYPPFIGGTAIGQWRPTPPLFGPMSAQGLAFTSMFVLDSNTQFRPAPPRASDQQHVHRRLQRGQSARPQGRIEPHSGADGARAVLGLQRQRSTGIRQRTRSHGPTTSPPPRAIGCSRS